MDVLTRLWSACCQERRCRLGRCPAAGFSAVLRLPDLDLGPLGCGWLCSAPGTATGSDAHHLHSYSDFNITLEYKESPQRGREGLLIAEPRCDLTGDLPDRVVWKFDLEPYRDLLGSLESPDVRVRDISDVGRLMGDLLLVPGVRELFHEAYSRLGDLEGLRLRLRCRDETTRRLPWEFARVDMGDGSQPRPLAVNPKLSLVRYETLHDRRLEPRVRAELVVASLDAGRAGGRSYADLSPDSPDPPRLFDSRPVQMITIDPPTRGSLERALRDQQVDIFHFSGHGEPSGPGSSAGLVLDYEQDTGTDILTGQALARILARAGVSMAVLSACHSGESALVTDGGGVARALVEIGIPIVVGMQHQVEAAHAAEFNKSFYQTLFTGATVDEAVCRGRIRLYELGADYGRPVLYHRSGSGRFLRPIATRAERGVAGVGHHEKPGPTASSRERPAPPGVRGEAAVQADAGPGWPAGSWSQLSWSGRSWRIETADRGPIVLPLRGALEALPAPTDHRVLAVSADCRAVAQWAPGGIQVAWINRVVPRLVRWPASPPLLDDGAAWLLAVTTGGEDEIKMVLTTADRTYQVRLGQRYHATVRVLVDEPSRAAVYLGSTACTVDAHGRIRDHLLRQKLPPMEELIALDAARSGGETLVGALGLAVGDRAPILVAASDRGYPYLEILARPATALTVVRQLDPSIRPDCILTAVETTVSAHKITQDWTR